MIERHTCTLLQYYFSLLSVSHNINTVCFCHFVHCFLLKKNCVDLQEFYDEGWRACFLKRNQLLWAFDQHWPVFFFVAPGQGLSMERPSKPRLFSEAGVATWVGPEWVSYVHQMEFLGSPSNCVDNLLEKSQRSLVSTITPSLPNISPGTSK